MNLSVYIRRRKNLSDLDLIDLSKSKYNKEKDDYKKLIKISDDLNKNKDQEIFKYIYFFIPIILSLILSLGYVDKSTNQINILFFILVIIIIPFGLMTISLVGILYKRSSNSCFNFITEKIQDEIVKEGIKKVSCFYLQGISIIFSVLSIVILLFLTAIESYKFYFATTWLSNNFFTSIIDFFSYPIKMIFPGLIPSHELIIESSKNASSNSIWLWFLISLLVFWILIPRTISLIFAFYFSQKALKNSFLYNSKSKRILEYLKPKITTTDYEKEEIYNSSLKSKNGSIDIKNTKEQMESKYSKILLYSLNENAINAIKNDERYLNIDIESYHRNMNFKDFTSNVLIIINVQSSPKMIAINMMRKLSHCSLYLCFVDDNGSEVFEDSNILEWKRFLKEKEINIELPNE